MASDDDAASCVKFLNYQARYAPEGSIKPMLDHHDADGTFTLKTTKYQYQRSQFLKQLVQVGFDSLSQTTENDGSIKWSYTATMSDPDNGGDDKEFTFYFSQTEILQSVTLTECDSETGKDQFATDHDISPGDTTVVINGVEYYINLSIPTHFLCLQKPDVIFNFAVFTIGNTSLSAAIAAVITEFGLDAFGKAFAGIEGGAFKSVWSILNGAVKAGYRFARGLMTSLLEGESAADAVVVALELAGEAWATAMEELTAALLSYSVIGIIVMAAVFAFFKFIFKQSYQKVFVYNLTEFDIELSFPYIQHGALYNLPTHVVPAPSETSSDGFDLGKMYNAVCFTMQSDSETVGIQYTMKIDFKKPGTSETVQTFSALFDIPMSNLAQNNALLCKPFDPTDENYDSYEDWFNKAGHEFRDYYYTWDDLHVHDMSVSYDYLSGDHPDPESGQKIHLFNSVVYIGKKGGG